MKRILIFNDSLALGGTEILLLDLLRHLSSVKGCDVTLLLPQPSDADILLEKVDPSVRVRYLYDKHTSYIKRKTGENIMVFCPRVFAKLKGIKASDYDLAICFKESFYARIFSVMPISKVLWIHNILYKPRYEIRSFREWLAVSLNKWQIKTVQRSYSRFDKVICVSDACKKAYLDVLHANQLPLQDIRILYNALDLTKVVEKSKMFIPELPKRKTNFILLTRLSPEKRTDRLLEAAARLRAEGYDFLVYLAGEGLDSEAMNNIIVQKDLEGNIILMGRLDNPYPYILQSDWLLCVSERESFSLTLLEAMALDVPVITTDCGGPADIVAGGKYGILVGNNTEGVYQGMKSVLDNPPLSEVYRASLKESLERFDYQNWLSDVDRTLNIE